MFASFPCMIRTKKCTRILASYKMFLCVYMFGKRQIVGGESIFFYQKRSFSEKLSHLFRYPILVAICLENLSKKMFP